MRILSVFVPLALAVMLSAVFLPGIACHAQDSINPDPSRLLVVWTSGDRDVALKMVYMYTYNAKKNDWWDEVQLLVWGPSAKLLAEDAELKEYVGRMKKEGVILTACKACADSYGVSETLAELGIEVKYMGLPLTEMLKEGWTTITF